MAGGLFFRWFRSAETRLHELNYLFWECTTRCNLRCRHCGSDCGIAERTPDMPLEDFLQALDTLPVPEGGVVVLTGGEPLLRPDLPLAGREIRRRGWAWGIVSNGWFYDEARHRTLMEAGMATLTISLDGLEEQHDWMRGRSGSYLRAEQAIALAAREKRLAFDVVTCVNQRNIGSLDAIYDRLAALGVPQWRLFTIIPIGRAAVDPLMRLAPGQTRRLMEFIRARREAGGPMRVTFSCEGYLGPYERVVRDAPCFCHAGINIASVLIDGRICACPNIDRDVFSQGNIYTDNLYSVWQTRFGALRDRSWTRKGPCRDCKAWRDCLGGGMHNWHGACEAVLQCHLDELR